MAFILFRPHGNQGSPVSSTDVLTSVYYNKDIGSVLDTTVSGGKLYAVGNQGVAVFDFSNPSSPKILASVKTDVPFFDITITGQYAYVTAGQRRLPNGELRIYDLSKLSNLTPIGKVVLPEGAVGLVVKDSIAYVGDYASGLYIVDVKDPSNPKILSNFRRSEVDQNKYNQVLDLAKNDPNKLEAELSKIFSKATALDQILSKVSPEFIANQLSASGHVWWPETTSNLVLMPNDVDGMYIVDVANPSNPVQVSHFNLSEDMPNYWNTLAVQGNYIYAALDYRGIAVIDISDLSNPKLLTHINPWPGYKWGNAPGHAVQVKIKDGLAFFSMTEDGMYVYNITNPKNPILVQKTGASVAKKKGCNWGLELSGDYVIASYNLCNAGETGGFEVFQISGK